MPEQAVLRVLLIGASGVFGSRLAERLAVERDVVLTLAGRRRAPLETLAARIGGGSVRTLDRKRVHARDLGGYDLVIDAAGPFQDSATALVEAALAAGIDYLDLADGRDWVVGFGERFDRQARKAGVALITGASSIPALSHAVLDRLVAEWSEVKRVSVGIFPGNRAPRGRAVVEAILSYTGKPVRVFEDGAWCEAWGWGQLHRVDAGMAGRRWASLCDTPEQDLLVTRYRPSESARFHAGMELTVLHIGLWLLSLPVRWGWVRSLRPWARPMLAIARMLLPFGSDRGAMLVEAYGTGSDGAPAEASWGLAATGNRGPFVPVLAGVAMVRRRRDRGREEPGARVCSGILTLDDFADHFLQLELGVTIGR